MLQEMSRACKPDGQILLLEHGVGTSPWINKMLHNGAEQHLKHWGCQWDRDIEGIVKEVCHTSEQLSLMGVVSLFNHCSGRSLLPACCLSAEHVEIAFMP